MQQVFLSLFAQPVFQMKRAAALRNSGETAEKTPRSACSHSGDRAQPISFRHRRYPAGVTTAAATGVDVRQRRAMAGLLLAAALLIAAYWLAWLLHRSLVASETGAAYTQFEDSFPLADGWLALCLLAASYCLWTARRAALFWLLAGGGAGLYLFAMDVLYDLQHGVWGKGANGAVELIINVVTLALSLFVLRWTWVRRDALLSS
jgi:hypothetical protein